jgi:diguanylate cyclase (GGDEF)-like protein
VGFRPTIFARPVPPRVSFALALCGAIVIFAGGAVQSALAALAAVAIAVVAWWFGPLIGGIVTGALTSLVIMTDPYLPHPMATTLLVWVVILEVMGMVTGMVARRESNREADGAFFNDFRSSPRRSPTPVRGSKQITGEMAPTKQRSNPEIQALKLPPRVTAEKPAATEPFPDLIDANTGELAVHDLERDVVSRFLRDVKDALGADEVGLWQHLEDTDEVKPYAAAVRTPEELRLTTKPPVETLVHAASLGGIGTNYDSELNYFYAIPAGAEGRFHGALGVYAEDGRAFNRDRAKGSLKMFADRLAEILHLLYDGRETRRYRGKVEEVATAVQRIQKQQETKALYGVICRSAREVCAASRAALVTWDKGSESWRVVHMDPPGPFPPTIAPASLVGEVLGRDPEKYKDRLFQYRENFKDSAMVLYAAGDQSAKPGSAGLVALTRERDGQVIGGIVVTGDRPGQIASVELNNLKTLGRTASAQLVAVRQFEEAKGQATRDALTGLYNRGAFDERIKSMLAFAEREGQPLSLILTDVDKFKTVNDTYGHAGGDEVLRTLGKLMASGQRKGDFVARYGGEEIALILPNQKSEQAALVAERLRGEIERLHIVFEEKHIPVTASFGVATIPEHAVDDDTLFKAADEALYAAKNAGRNCVFIAAAREVES